MRLCRVLFNKTPLHPVISSANTTSPSTYRLTIHIFIQHCPMMTPQELAETKNRIKMSTSDIDKSMAFLNKLKLDKGKAELLLSHLRFRRCLTLDSLWESTLYSFVCLFVFFATCLSRLKFWQLFS